MQHNFKHPHATHPAGAVIGHRRNGAPIYVIAGGSDEGDAAPPAGEPAAAVPTTPAPAAPAGDDAGTDWKTHAREWEKRAKANAKAADELTKLREQNMSEQEKAVTEAEKAGRTAAVAEFGARLAAAQFDAATARAGLDLGDASDLIDTSRFVTESGDVDTKAIEAAVKKLAKLAPRGAGRSGADLGGSGSSGDQAASLDKQIQEAIARRDFPAVIRLKRQKAATT